MFFAWSTAAPAASSAATVSAWPADAASKSAVTPGRAAVKSLTRTPVHFLQRITKEIYTGQRTNDTMASPPAAGDARDAIPEGANPEVVRVHRVHVRSARHEPRD